MVGQDHHLGHCQWGLNSLSGSHGTGWALHAEAWRDCEWGHVERQSRRNPTESFTLPGLPPFSKLQEPTCVCPPSTGVTSVYHHTEFVGVFFWGGVLMWDLGIEPWASCLHSQHFPDHPPALALYRSPLRRSPHHPCRATQMREQRSPRSKFPWLG